MAAPAITAAIISGMTSLIGIGVSAKRQKKALEMEEEKLELEEKQFEMGLKGEVADVESQIRTYEHNIGALAADIEALTSKKETVLTEYWDIKEREKRILAESWGASGAVIGEGTAAKSIAEAREKVARGAESLSAEYDLEIALKQGEMDFLKGEIRKLGETKTELEKSLAELEAKRKARKSKKEEEGKEKEEQPRGTSQTGRSAGRR